MKRSKKKKKIPFKRLRGPVLKSQNPQALTHSALTPVNSSSRAYIALFWLLRVLHACNADILGSKAPTHIYFKLII